MADLNLQTLPPVSKPAVDQQQKVVQKKTSPYNSEMGQERKNNFLGSVAAGLVKPLVQTGVSVVDVFADLGNVFSGKKQSPGGSGYRLKSNFLGGDDGYVYSFLDQVGRTSTNLGRRVARGDISFAKGLIGSVAAGVEPAIDVGSLVYGGEGTVSLVKELANNGANVLFKKAVSTALKTSLTRGGAFAGAYDAIDQFKKAEDYNVMRTIGAVAAGTVLDVGLSQGIPALRFGIGKSGELVSRAVPEVVKNTASDVALSISRSVRESGAGKYVTNFLGNKEASLSRLGDTGVKVRSMFETAYNRMENEIRHWQGGLIDLGIVEPPLGTAHVFNKKLERWGDKEFRFDVRDALGHTGKFANEKTYQQLVDSDPELKKIVEFFDVYRKDKGLLGQQMNIVENLDDIETYFSRYTPHVELLPGTEKRLARAATDAEREAIYAANSSAVSDMIDYGFAREKKWSSRLEGFKNYYDAMDIALDQRRVPDNENSYLAWMVREGNAPTILDAKKALLDDLSRRQSTLTPRVASFDYERKAPMPWHDPDPVRVMTKYVEDTNKRLAYAEQFGVNDEKIQKMIDDLQTETSGDKAKQLIEIFRRATGQVERAPRSQRTASFFTNLEVIRLVKSALLNVPQTLLYAFPTDMGSFFYGLRTVFSNKKIMESMDRGIFVSDLARQTRTAMSWDRSVAEGALKYSGFNYLDMMVKSMGSGVIDSWLPKIFKRLERKLGIELPDVERASLSEGFLRDKELQKAALREAYSIQKASAKSFNNEFPGESFTAVAGERGRAAKYSTVLDKTYEKEVARLENSKKVLEKSLVREGRPFTSKEEEVQTLISEIKEIRASIEIYQGDEIPGNATPEEEFSRRQVDQALAKAKELTIQSLNERVAQLTDQFDEARALGTLESPNVTTPRLQGEQRLAQLNEKIKSIDVAMEDAATKQERKKLLLQNIVDSYSLANAKLNKENPDVVVYRSKIEASRTGLASRNLPQYPEYHYLKELGLDPEQVLAQGHLTSDDFATATRSLVEQTQGTNNPLMTPLFAETAWGKVFYQFKKIVLQEAIFFGKQFKRNLISKDTRSFGNATRFLTVAFVVYPPTMGVIRDTRDLLTGKKSPDEVYKFDEYWKNLQFLSATGLFMDFAKSYDTGHELEFFLPIILSDALEYMSGIFKESHGAGWKLLGGSREAEKEMLDGFNSLKDQLIRQSGVADLILNRLKKK